MSMKKMPWLLTAALIAALALASLGGCESSDQRQARQLVDEALTNMSEVAPVLQDLSELNALIAQLGERFNNLQDTVSEGMSLVRLITDDLNEAEGILVAAREMFTQVTALEDAGEYVTYASMARDAVQAQLDAVQTDRELVATLADLLSLVDMAESEEQLQYYANELDRLSAQLNEQFNRAAGLAAEADAFLEEKKL